MSGLAADEQANKIRGYKSTLSNPNVSQEAKDNAKQELKALGAGDFNYEEEVPDENTKNPGNVAGGLKAAINNPNVSEEGAKAAQQKLDQMK